MIERTIDMCKIAAIRKRARSLANHIGHRLLIRAQGGVCPICNQPILPDQQVSVDHVYSIYDSVTGDQDPNPGNILIVHHKCNQLKGSRKPTQSEILYLTMVNDILGFDHVTGVYAVTEYARGTVVRRRLSLEARRNNIDFDISADRQQATTAQINFAMLTAEIDSLDVMLAQYEEVFEIHEPL